MTYVAQGDICRKERIKVISSQADKIFDRF